MKIVFLTEYSKVIGFGHISRCLSLADALVLKGYSITFLVREWDDEPLALKYPTEKVEWEKPDQLQKYVSRDNMLIFDTYLVEKGKLTELSSPFQRVVSIADSRLNFAEKGVVLFANPYAPDFSNNSEHLGFKILNGPEYLLYRSEFWQMPKNRPDVKSEIKKVLICLGGHVNKEMLRITVASLQEVLKDIEIIVLGHLDDSFNNAVKAIGFLQPSELISEYLQADLVVSNGGQTLNEVILAGIPVVGIAVAENQKRNLQFWMEARVIVAWSEIDSSNYQNEFKRSVHKMKDASLREHMAYKGKLMVDALGAQRAVDKILKNFCEI